MLASVPFGILALALSSLALPGCALTGAGGEPPPGAYALLEPPPPLPGLSDASESAYAALFRARTPDGAPAARKYVKEPDLLRPLSLDRLLEGEAREVLAAAALSTGWKLRCPLGLGRARVAVGPGAPLEAGTVLDLALEIDSRLAASGETLKVDVFTRTFAVERRGQ
jgi:hypothetical protein